MSVLILLREEERSALSLSLSCLNTESPGVRQMTSSTHVQNHKLHLSKATKP